MENAKLNGTREAVASHVVEILQSLLIDKDPGPITLETALGDTGLDSVCVASLIGDIQQSYGLRSALFRALVKPNVPILTLRVSEIVDCVCETLALPAAKVEGVK
jgi:acyl carrier protein